MLALLTQLGLSQDVLTVVESFLFPITLIAVIALCFLAFNGYKIFKFVIVVAGAVLLGYAGNAFLAPILVDVLGEETISQLGINLAPIVGFLCALIGSLVAWFFCNVIIFLVGGVGGYILGNTLTGIFTAANPDVAFLQSPVATIAISAICALICAILTVLLFKFIYILSTSVAGMAAAGYAVGLSSVVAPDSIIPLALAGVGAFVGIFAMVHQYKTSDQKYDYYV